MKLKKLMALLLAMMMVFSLAACGGSSTSSGSETADNQGTEEAAPAEGEAETEEAAPAESEAAAGGVIKLGGIGPTTGAAAIYGQATEKGAAVAVEEINALGGLQFELNWQDDEHDPEKSVNAYNNLKDWGMQVLVGTTTTKPCVAVAAETNADRFFQLTPSASSTDVTDGRDNVFQMCFTDPNQGITAAKYIQENGLGTKVAVIYNNADAYSTGIAQAFSATADEVGLSIVSTTTFTDDTTDFNVQLLDAKTNEADLVFLPIYYTPASLILKQAKDMEYAPTFFGVDGMDGILDMEGFDTSLAEGVVLMTPFNPWGTDEKTESFVSKFEETYGGKPNQFAADSYDCVYAIYEALQQNGITAESSHEDICEALIATFTGGFTFDGTTGSSMTWSSNGEVSKAPIVVTIQNGIYVNN